MNLRSLPILDVRTEVFIGVTSAALFLIEGSVALVIWYSIEEGYASAYPNVVSALAVGGFASMMAVHFAVFVIVIARIAEPRPMSFDKEE